MALFGEKLILLTAFAILSGACQSHRILGEEIFVRTSPSFSVERLADAVRPIGLLESRRRGTYDYLVQLKPGIDDEAARERLEKVPGVRPLEPDEEPYDIHSVHSLSRKIAHLEREEKRESKDRHESVGQPRRDKGDYLRAYRYFISQRAFPNDTLDWTSFGRGRDHANKMAPARLGWSGVRPEAAPAWSFLGPTNLSVPYEIYYGIGPVSGRVNAVAYDPNNSQTIYAGGAEGGLWKSTDGGITWSWLSSTWTELGVNCIVIDPSNSDTIYVGRGDYHGFIASSYGIMKSNDGGGTWTEIAETSMGQVGVDHILMDPTNSQVLLAGTGDSQTFGSLYRSTNAGQTWTKLSVGGNDSEWPTIASSAPVGSTVRFYAVAAGIASSTGNKSRVYKSDDHGATWQLLPSPLSTNGVSFFYAYEVATSPTNPNNVYVLDSENQTLITSGNQGATWTNVSATLPAGTAGGVSDYNWSQSDYDYHLECGTRGTGDLLFLGEIDLTESADGGRTWTSIGGPTYELNAVSHNDQHCLTLNPINPNQALFGNDGGVYTVTYNPNTGLNTVVPLSKNLQLSMFYKIACHPTEPNFILGGTQDNATPITTGDLSNWLNVGGGDGGGSVINQANPLLQYTSSEGMAFYRTDDGWNTHHELDPIQLNTGENYQFVSPMVLDPSNQSILYMATNFLYQWNDANYPNGWTNRLGNHDLTNRTNTTPTVYTIAVAPTDSKRIYTGSSDAALWMSEDQGSTWTQLDAARKVLPNQAINSISVSPYDENDILVGYSGNGQGLAHLYRCTNAAAKTVSFTNVQGVGSNGLPDVSLNAIARDLDNPASTWWVAMDSGVFETTNAGQTWANAGSAYGLPNVIVEDLAAVPGTRFLNAGTYGRGMWRLPLSKADLVSSFVSFILNPPSASPGGTTTGTLTLSNPAPNGGITVTLASSSTAVATVPASVTIPAGSTSRSFSVTGNPKVSSSASAVITATYGGLSFSQDVTVTIPVLSSVSVLPASVTGGSSCTGTVTLAAITGGGATVKLSSSNTSCSVPATVTVPAGSSSATFSVTTNSVSTAATVTITAKLGSVSKIAKVTVEPDLIGSIALSPTSVVGGVASSGLITLNSPAGSKGVAVKVTSSSTSASVPATVTVPNGAKSASFAIKTAAVAKNASVNITATTGTASQKAALSILAPTLQSVSTSLTTVQGSSTVKVVGTVTVSSPAPTSGLAISLKSSNAALSVPATVTLAAGKTTASFTISHKKVSSALTVTITATFGGVAHTTTLAVTP